MLDQADGEAARRLRAQRGGRRQLLGHRWVRLPGAADQVLEGGYVFGDYCSGRIWVVASSAPPPATPTLLRDATASPQLSISSFGEGDAGELYVVDRGGERIYRIRAVAKG
jgi:hypothetical protein